MFWLTVYKADTMTFKGTFGHRLWFLGIALDGHVLNRTPTIRVNKQIAFGYLIPDRDHLYNLDTYSWIGNDYW